MRYGVAYIHCQQLLDHTDVPDLHYTVRVACRYVLASDREHGVINGIEMSIEGLNSETRSHIPH